MKYGLAFLIMATLDFCWAKYIAHVNNKRGLLAGVWSAAIVLGSALYVIGYTDDHWLIIPGTLGAFVGTYLAVVLPRISCSPEPFNLRRCGFRVYLSDYDAVLLVRVWGFHRLYHIRIPY